MGAVPIAARNKLFLLFRIAQERFALDALEVAEVLPLLPLKPVPQAPTWVAGVFAHRGRVVPVLDVSALSFGVPAVRRTSTRLVLVHYPNDQAGPQARLGLIVEFASETLRCDPRDFKPSGVHNRATPYLGPVREDSQGLLQWLRVQDLLEPAVRELLFAPQLAASVVEEGAQ
jgi:chemotaxis-related protein WspB